MYNMGNGYVHIINNMDFERLTSRQGSEVDVDLLKSFFQLSVNWNDFHIRKNQTVQEMKDELATIARYDYTSYGAFFLIILSHGTEYGLCGKDSNPNDPQNVLDVERDVLPLFASSKCPSLSEKPKVFIMQACRGNMDDNGHLVQTDAVRTEPPRQYRFVPDTSEYLLCYPCAPGYTSLRNTGEGSLFIRSLVLVFKEKYRDEDISRMLLRVNHNVALQNVTLRIKQMPSHDNRLTRLTFFEGFFINKRQKIK